MYDFEKGLKDDFFFYCFDQKEGHDKIMNCIFILMKTEKKSLLQ